jgi:hypothetical protein
VCGLLAAFQGLDGPAGFDIGSKWRSTLVRNERCRLALARASATCALSLEDLQKSDHEKDLRCLVAAIFAVLTAGAKFRLADGYASFRASLLAAGLACFWPAAADLSQVQSQDEACVSNQALAANSDAPVAISSVRAASKSAHCFRATAYGRQFSCSAHPLLLEPSCKLLVLPRCAGVHGSSLQCTHLWQDSRKVTHKHDCMQPQTRAQIPPSQGTGCSLCVTPRSVRCSQS